MRLLDRFLTHIDSHVGLVRSGRSHTNDGRSRRTGKARGEGAEGEGSEWTKEAQPSESRPQTIEGLKGSSSAASFKDV